MDAYEPKSGRYSRPVEESLAVGRKAKCFVDKRPEAVAQARMINVMNGSPGNMVVQCSLWMRERFYDTFKEVKRLLANDWMVGWDDRWAPSLHSLMATDQEFRTEKELEELLNKMTFGYFQPQRFQDLGVRPPSWMKSVPSKDAYEKASREWMQKREGILPWRIGGVVSLYHGTSLVAAQAIQQGGFLTTANPVYRGYLDASRDGFLSFSPLYTDSYQITFRMRATPEDVARWQFKMVSEGQEVVTTLSVPTYRLQWKKKGVPGWRDMSEPIC